MKNKCSILIADDHPVFRKGLIDIIKDLSDHEIIAEAENGQQAFELISGLQPDIAILDINMPRLSGFEVVKEITKLKAINPSGIKTKIIFLTMHKEEEILNKALDYNASGYILKECAVDDIIDCINFVAENKVYISPQISGLFLQRNQLQNRSKDRLTLLTPAEMKVLSHIADEKTSREIAELLFISVRTVDNHRTNICHKLNLHGVNSLLKFALDNKHLL